MASEATTLTVTTMDDLSVFFKRAVARFIEKDDALNPGEVAEVLSWDEYTSGGGCDTCGWGAGTQVTVEYRAASTGKNQSYYYDGYFSRLLSDILAMDEHG